MIEFTETELKAIAGLNVQISGPLDQAEATCALWRGIKDKANAALAGISPPPRFDDSGKLPPGCA